MTAAELLVMPDNRSQLSELVRGRLITKSLYGMTHAGMCAQIASSLAEYVHSRGLGVAVGANAGFILECNPDTVRAPHAAFVCNERRVRTDEHYPGAPDLAVEFEEPGVADKVREWLAAGTRMVIVIDPEKQTASIRTANATTDLTIDDALDGGDVVPGWRLPLRELFE